MNPRGLSLLLIFLMMPAALAQTAPETPVKPNAKQSKDAPTKSAADAIRAVLDAQVAAWNTGKLEEFMDGYWRDEKLTFISGDNVAQGWDATRDRYIKRYKSEGKEMGELAFENLETESFGPNVAMVRGRYVLNLKSAKETATLLQAGSGCSAACAEGAG